MFLYNSNALIIKNKKLLVVGEKGQRLFLLPGGGIEPNESPEECLKREVNEELGVGGKDLRLKKFETFKGPSKGRKYQRIMHTFLVKLESDNIEPSREIAEVKWIDTKDRKNVRLEWILKNFVLPKLQSLGLIN